MMVVTLRIDESVVIGAGVRVIYKRIAGHSHTGVVLAIDAPGKPVERQTEISRGVWARSPGAKEPGKGDNVDVKG